MARNRSKSSPALVCASARVGNMSNPTMTNSFIIYLGNALVGGNTR